MSNFVHVKERNALFSNGAAGGRVDREKNLITGVKLMGWESRNGATYDKAAFSKKAAMYEGALVNIDHGSDTVGSRFGRFVGAIEARDDGFYGTIKYNPHLPNTESILWFVENDPAAIGMSPDHIVKMQLGQNGHKLYTDVSRVNSVDIVANPATTKGVFENMNPDGTMSAAPTDGASGGEGDSVDAFKAQLGDLLKVGATSLPSDKFREVVKHLLNAHGILGDSGEKDKAAAESLQKEVVTLKAANADLTTKLDGYQVREKLDEKKTRARQLCKAAQLPEVAVTEHFINTLAAKDDDGMNADIADRKKIVGVREGKPTSAGPDTGKVLTMEQFAQFALTGKAKA